MQFTVADLPLKQALILDFDGVVVETEQLHFDCWNAAFLECFGLQLGGTYRQIVGLTLEQLYALWCGSGEGERLALSPAMKRRVLERKTELYFELGAGAIRPAPGLINLIENVRKRGWYVTIASRARRMRLWQTLEMARIPPLFDIVMGTEDVVDPATDRKVHSRTVFPFAIDPGRCIVVEDSVSGICDAVNCGIGTVVGITTSMERSVLMDAGARPVVDSLTEIEVLLIEHADQKGGEKIE